MSKERTPAQPEAVKISYLFELAGSKKTGLYIAVIFSVLSGLCTFVPCLMIFRTVLFLFDGNGNSTEAMRYGLIAAAFILLRFIFQAISVTLTHYGAYSALYAVRKKICEHIGKVNLGFFTDNSTGEIKKVLMEDVERLEQFLAHQVPDITVAIVVPLTVFVYLLTVNIPMALILAVPIILTLVLQSIMMVLVTPKMQDFSVVQGQLNSALLQFVNGMPVMKAYNLTANSYQAYSKAGEDFNVLWKQISRMAAPISAVCKVLIESGVSFTLPMGGFLYLAGYLDLSSYVFFVIMSIVFLEYVGFGVQTGAVGVVADLDLRVGQLAQRFDGFGIGGSHVGGGDHPQMSAVLGELTQLLDDQSKAAPFDEGYQHVDAVGTGNLFFQFGKHLGLAHRPGEQAAAGQRRLRACQVCRGFSGGQQRVVGP